MWVEGNILVINMYIFWKYLPEIKCIWLILFFSAHLDMGYSSPGLPSVDSAVESWDSGMEPALLNGGLTFKIN